MSLDLDDRQRAMLQEMGVHVWWPQTEVAQPERQLASAAPTADVATVAPGLVAPLSPVAAIEDRVIQAISVRGSARHHADLLRASTPAGDAPGDAVAGMDWASLSSAVAACQACQMGSGRRAPVFGALPAPRQADWLVVGDPPEEAEERAGAPFAGQVGQLLDNMLMALDLRRQDGAGEYSGARAAYLTNVVKCRPALPRAPDAQDLATCEVFLKREIALVQPKVILALGRLAAQSLLRESEPEAVNTPLGKLRGKVYRYHGIAVVVSYHPGYLLRTPQDKARAWADLCLALSVARPSPDSVVFTEA